MKPNSNTKPAVATSTGISEVRYSLPELLREVQLERNAAVFAMEKLDRVEISKIFQKTRPRRALKTNK